MNAYVDKTQDHSVVHKQSQNQHGKKAEFQFVDHRPEAIQMQELQQMANKSPKVAQLRALQEMVNNSPQVSQLRAFISTQAKQTARLPSVSKSVTGSPSGMIVQREVINNTLVVSESGYLCFKIGGKKYHINYGDPAHVTCDSDGRTHYYFKGLGTDIQDAVGPGRKKKGKKTIKFKFSQLPGNVQDFVKNYWTELLGVTEEGSISV